MQVDPHTLSPGRAVAGMGGPLSLWPLYRQSLGRVYCSNAWLFDADVGADM